MSVQEIVISLESSNSRNHNRLKITEPYFQHMWGRKLERSLCISVAACGVDQSSAVHQSVSTQRFASAIDSLWLFRSVGLGRNARSHASRALRAMSRSHSPGVRAFLHERRARPALLLNHLPNRILATPPRRSKRPELMARSIRLAGPVRSAALFRSPSETDWWVTPRSSTSYLPTWPITPPVFEAEAIW